MIFNWIDRLEIPEVSDYNNHQLGRKVEFWNQDSSFISNTDVTILFSNKIDPNKLRKELYQQYNHFSVRLIELGKVKKTSKDFLSPLIQELISNNRLIYIGPKEDLAEFLNSEVGKKLGLVNKLIVTSSIASEISDTTNYIGFQRHISIIDEIIRLTAFNKASLGDIRSDINKAEPIIRDRSSILFDINSLEKRFSHSKNSKITGLTIEEACKIAKFAGHNGALKLFHLAVDESEIAGDWEETAALILWYLIEGMDNCFVEAADDIDNQTYIVNNENFENPITFVKGNLTGRWWIEDPRNSEFTAYIPCELEDYDKLSQGIIPDKFLSLEI